MGQDNWKFEQIWLKINSQNEQMYGNADLSQSGMVIEMSVDKDLYNERVS